jgi:hypothetical protein
MLYVVTRGVGVIKNVGGTLDRSKNCDLGGGGKKKSKMIGFSASYKALIKHTFKFQLIFII